ncbi:hypothetical protein F0562_030557 [Nyssa sinensis]|uniref:Protein kinase domain-containing protein n=1 Tax=Nyssa sinensis TaxID=561372 RepID=A0A5J5B196_9ASTE|nr:hypothetical protein F0562_030557 [Nyssa sinensis]
MEKSELRAVLHIHGCAVEAVIGTVEMALRFEDRCGAVSVEFVGKSSRFLEAMPWSEADVGATAIAARAAVTRLVAPSNVLLDEDMVAHVSDFRISKILAASRFIAQTKTIGTIGYIVPEYGTEGIVSTSGDVYSYGIMLMETFTKRKPTEEMFTENSSLRYWVKSSYPTAVMQIVDANLFNGEDEMGGAEQICISSVIE